MTMTCLGRVNVTAPGTPVPLATNPAITACKVFAQVIPGLTGKTYVGATSRLNKSTLAGVNRILAPNAAGSVSDSFYLESQDGTDSLRLMDYSIDADVAGEGLLVTYWTE